MTNNYWTPEEYAKEFKCHINTVYKRIKSGELLSIKLGRHFRIPKEPPLGVPTEQKQELVDYDFETRRIEQELHRLEVETRLNQAKGEFCLLKDVASKQAELDKREAELDARISPEDLDKWEKQLEERQRKVEKQEKEAAKLPKRDTELTKRENLLKANRGKLNEEEATFEKAKAAFNKGLTEERRATLHVRNAALLKTEKLLDYALKLVHAKDKERNEVIANIFSTFGISESASQDKEVQKIMGKRSFIA